MSELDAGQGSEGFLCGLQIERLVEVRLWNHLQVKLARHALLMTSLTIVLLIQHTTLVQIFRLEQLEHFLVDRGETLTVERVWLLCLGKFYLTRVRLLRDLNLRSFLQPGVHPSQKSLLSDGLRTLGLVDWRHFVILILMEEIILIHGFVIAI